MSKNTAGKPGKHRAAKHKAARKGLLADVSLPARVRSAALMSGVAVAATGVVVGSGVVLKQTPLSDAATAIASPKVSEMSAAEISDRESQVSRSAERAPLTTPVKAAALSNATGAAKVGTEDLTVADPKTLTRALMPQYGLDPADFDCVDRIWTQESNWNVHADNPSSSAYGIPQALPGSKMSSAGPNWENSAETQIRWGLGYIKGRYGSACGAWSFKASHGWY